MDAGHGVEGCNYCSPSRWRWIRCRDTHSRAGSRATAIRRSTRHGDASPHPLARGDGARPRRRAVARRSAGAAFAAPGSEGAARACGRARLHADDGQRARILPSPRDVRGGPREGVLRPDPFGAYILDYHILATTYDEAFLRQIRNGMHAAGMRVETSKGEAWPGQQEIDFRLPTR